MEDKSNTRGGMPEVGSIDWFKRYFWTVNPVGTREGDDYKNAYYWSGKAVGDVLPDGSFLTWEELLERYTNFFNYMSERQNGKYTKKEHSLLSITDYCSAKMYLNDYSKLETDILDLYLFGI